MGLAGAGRSRGCHKTCVAPTALTQQRQRTHPVAREASRRTQATPPAVRIDTDLSRWYCAGELNAVDYAADEPPTPAPPPEVRPP